MINRASLLLRPGSGRFGAPNAFADTSLEETSIMKNRRPYWAIPILCLAAAGLSSCQSSSGSPFGGLFGATQTPPPSCSATVNDDGRVTKLEKENARLKKQLARAMEDNATLRDLAAKKW